MKQNTTTCHRVLKFLNTTNLTLFLIQPIKKRVKQYQQARSRNQPYLASSHPAAIGVHSRIYGK